MRQLQTGLIATEDRVLDLDDGRVLSLPANLNPNGMNNPRPLLNWMCAEGADLWVTDAGPDLHLHLDDGLLVRLTNSATFEDVEAAEIERSLSQRGVFRAVQSLRVPKTQVGANSVLGFKTREGGLGVLQLLATVDRPPSVKLQYRMLRSSNRANRAAPNDVPPASRNPAAPGGSNRSKPATPAPR